MFMFMFVMVQQLSASLCLRRGIAARRFQRASVITRPCQFDNVTIILANEYY